MMSGRTSIVWKRLVAGIALYGLILHTGLSTVHFYANLNPAGSLHGLAEICFGLGGTGERANDAPSDQKAADYSCPMCVRLAGLHLAPPPAPWPCRSSFRDGRGGKRGFRASAFIRISFARTPAGLRPSPSDFVATVTDATPGGRRGAIHRNRKS